VAAGDIIDLGTFAAIAIRDILAGELGELDSWDSPTYRCTKFTGEAIAKGAPVYYDAGTNTASGTIAYSEAFLGYCVNDGGALAGDATVDVKLASP
jgi:predicted RecA/RadA family phage recombinase